ncbi:MAG TPA: 16S rRNA (cytosine(1402)-N(4))-methyltransferase, partial [Treponemataceae bacterium]|nr:16S rRNA (cytosine(1402)-N(4))-methyltransferase [Treponemataceae bacterium]
MEAVHTSVLLQEVLDYLDPRHGENLENPFLIDSTLGEGGHSFAFLKAFPELQVLGLDADAEIQKRAK